MSICEENFELHHTTTGREFIGSVELTGGGLVDFDDVSAVVDGFWSAGCRGQFLICRLCHKSDIQSQH